MDKITESESVDMRSIRIKQTIILKNVHYMLKNISNITKKLKTSYKIH